VSHRKKIAVLGSTGSIGVNTLDVIEAHRDKFEVVALSGYSNTERLSAQIRKHRPMIVATNDGESAVRLKRKVSSKKTKITCGREGLLEIVSETRADMIMFAISGVACLEPLLEAINRKKGIALANKEALVAAGEIVMKRAAEKGVTIIPVDSEHNAIFQCLSGRDKKYLNKIYLTSSGGPLHKVPSRSFDTLSKKFILEHPRWKMGRKISVDSATLMNKGLEVIEARWLFDVAQKNIEIIVHPEAIIHSMVEFLDGTIIAEMAMPDMRIPIQFALTYPERIFSKVPKVDLSGLRSLTFYRPSFGRFPCLGLAFSSLRRGRTYPAVLNAADEEAVKHYLKGKLSFSGIPRTIEAVLSKHKSPKRSIRLDDIFAADQWARLEVHKHCQ